MSVRKMLVILGVFGLLAAVQVPAAPAQSRPVAKLPAALVVKVDNVPKARPHAGLAAANAIYVEPVEGGFTRLAAVYWGRRPSVIGPVRSARETDVKLLAYLRRPVLTYSGASPRLRPLLNAADLVHATPRTQAKAFFRINSKPSPHNLYVRPRKLPKTKPVGMPLRTGLAPAGGRRVNTFRVKYKAASYTFTWSKGGKRWRVTMDGRPFVSVGHGRLATDTVVVQRVRIVQGLNIHDSAGYPSPVAQTVGSGRMTMLRGGRLYEGKWTRRLSASQTTYRTTAGDPLPLKRGKVWVLLVPL